MRLFGRRELLTSRTGRGRPTAARSGAQGHQLLICSSALPVRLRVHVVGGCCSVSNICMPHARARRDAMRLRLRESNSLFILCCLSRDKKIYSDLVSGGYFLLLQNVGSDRHLNLQACLLRQFALLLQEQSKHSRERKEKGWHHGNPVRQVRKIHRVRQAGARGWRWNGVREKYCWASWSWSRWLQWWERKLL